MRPLHIIVCVKEVPDPRHLSKIKIDLLTMTIKREGIPTITNPLDEHALEEGLRLKETFGGKVSVLSMCPPHGEKTCREAMAMGADEAILLCDPAFAGADTLATAYTLSMAIKKLEPFDLILCGNETIDGGTAQVPTQLAEFLGLPHITRVIRIEPKEDGWLRVERSIENGRMLVEVELRSVLAVTKDINTPRLPTAHGIMRSYEEEVKIWTAEDIRADKRKIGLLGSPTQVKEIYTSEIRRRGEMLRGRSEEAARLLIQRLHELGAI